MTGKEEKNQFLMFFRLFLILFFILFVLPEILDGILKLLNLYQPPRGNSILVLKTLEDDMSLWQRYQSIVKILILSL